MPGNGPSDAYQTSQGTNLGTAESATPLNIDGVMVVKTATTAYTDGGYAKAGDNVNYSFAVTNTGGGTVTNIAVNDNNIPSADISCPSTTLAAGASETCIGTYTVTQADVDDGSVTNTATVSATSPSDETLTSAPSSVTVDASDATSSLRLDKSTSSAGYDAVGDTLNYDYLVTNTGTRTIGDISVSDNKVANVSCPDSSLAPTDSETCTGSYATDQTDVDIGSVVNYATASGTDPQGNAVTSAQSTVTVPEIIELTSPSSTTATEGVTGAPFTVTAAGGPEPGTDVTTSSTLPAGMSLVDNGDGTATLSGAPYCGTQGTYLLDLTAQNSSVATDGTQTLDLVVGTPSAATPAFDSADSATGTAGQPFGFTIQTDCVPLPTLTESGLTGSLGLRLSPGPAPGTDTLSGTPPASQAGIHSIRFVATALVSGAIKRVSQSFSLTLHLEPTITSKATAKAKVGTAMTAFTVKTTGFPAPAITYTGSLPGGVNLVDNGDGTATVSGTPDPGTGGAYPIIITAANGIGTAVSQPFTLTVDQAPALASVPTSLSLQRNVPMMPVTVTASGYPAPTFSMAGAPGGVTMSSSGTLSGTPKAGDPLKTYTVTVKARSAGVTPTATQTFTVALTPAPPS